MVSVGEAVSGTISHCPPMRTPESEGGTADLGKQACAAGSLRNGPRSALGHLQAADFAQRLADAVRAELLIQAREEFVVVGA